STFGNESFTDFWVEAVVLGQHFDHHGVIKLLVSCPVNRCKRPYSQNFAQLIPSSAHSASPVLRRRAATMARPLATWALIVPWARFDSLASSAYESPLLSSSTTGA